MRKQAIFSFLVILLVALSACAPAVVPSSSNSPTSVLPSQAGPATVAAGKPETPQNGWRAYTNAALRASLDYPADWKVVEQPTVASFIPPEGAPILLGVVTTGDLSPEDYLNENQIPNARCSSATNSNGMVVHTCLDTVASNHTAYIILKFPQGAPELLSLSMPIKQGDQDVFSGMVASIRPAP